MAQSAFEGFYAQAGVGYENNSVSSRTLNVTAKPSDSTTGSQGVQGAPTSSGGGFSSSIGLGYNYSVAPQWLIGIGADYVPTSVTTSTQNIINCTGCDGVPTNNYKVNNRYSIFITPGYEISKDQLVYLKGG